MDLKLRVLLAAIDKATAPLRSIQGQSIGAAKALKSARDKLKTLNETQKQINGFRELKQGLSATQTALQATQLRTQQLGQSLVQAQNPTRAMAREFEQAKRALQQLKQQETAQTQQLQQMRQQLNAAGVSTRALGEHERRLRQDIIGANQQMERQRQRLETLTRQQQRLTRAGQAYQRQQQNLAKLAGKGAAATAVGGATLYAGARLMAPGVEYGAQMSELQAVSRLDKGDERFTALKQQARDLGSSTAFSASQVGAGQTFLARAGFTPEAIKASMQDVLDLALANGLDLARTADISSNISSAFKIDPEVAGNITRVADVLSGVSARANVNLEMLGDTMKYMGSAEGLGLTLEQAATMAGLLGNIGIQGSQAGTTMRAMLNRLAAPPKDAANSIAELGLQVSDANGNLREMPDILQDIATATAKMGNTDQAGHFKRIFGVEAGSGMAELIEQRGKGALLALLDQLKNAQGENAKMALVRADNIDGDLKSLRSAWEEVGISITDVNDGPIRNLVQSITNVIRGIGNWIKAHPALSATLFKVVATVAMLAAILGGLTLAFAGIFGPLLLMRYGLALLGIRLPGVIGILKGFGKGLLMLGRIMVGPLITALRTVSIMLWGLAANPVFLVIAAVVAVLALAAYLIWSNWETLGPKFAALWEWIKGVFVNGTAQIVSFFSNGFNQIIDFFKDLWGKIKIACTGLFSELTTAWKGGLAGIGALILNWSPMGLFYSAFAAVMKYFGIELPGKFSEFGGMLLDGLVDGLTSGLGKVKETITAIGDSTIGWFKEKLGIHSPSRVFAELGGFTMAGLAQGLESGEKGPLDALTKISRDLTAAGGFSLTAPISPGLPAGGVEPLKHTNENQQLKSTLAPGLFDIGKQFATASALAMGAFTLPALAVDDRPPISSMASNTYDSHDHYEINIPPVPGMDAQLIARAVRAELARIASEKGARRRSRLTDLE